MRLTEFVFLIIVNEVLGGGGGGKHHVHFKIHVPEIIKHHIHTKTVFIHVHHGGGGGGGGKKKSPPKKKETHHDESHHEDWSSWSSYDVHGDNEKGHEHKQHGKKHTKTAGAGGHGHGTKSHVGHLTLGGHGQNYGYPTHNNPHGNPHPEMMFYPTGQFGNPHGHYGDAHHSSYVDGNSHPVSPGHGTPTAYHGSGLMGYSYPPQYGTHQEIENVKPVMETLHNDIQPYSDSFEEGYRKGLHSETGHILSEDQKNFYDDKFEEGDFSNNGYHDDGFENYKNSEDIKNDERSNDHENDYNQYDGDGYYSNVMETR